jgi:hypothetical protein
MAETALDRLVMLEYRVEESQRLALEEGEVVVYFVEGFGVATYVRDDDTEAIQSLVDSHDDRVAQIEANLAEEEA